MLPEGWQRSTLGTIGSIRSGGTPDRAKHGRYFTDGKWPWVKTMDLTNGEITTTDERITKAALSETSCRLFPKGTVLVAMYGGFNQIGRTGLLNEASAVNQAISAIEVDAAMADPMFVLHWLNGHVNVWRTFAASSRKDPNITRDDVCRFPIDLPPLAAQKHIAKVLSAWDTTIASAGRLLTNSRALRQALANALLSGRKRFQDRHPWQAKPISDLIVESRVGGSGGDEARKLTVKLYAKGVVAKADKRKGSGATQYYRRSAGQFIYSKLDFLNGAFGLIPDDLDGYESTLDLPAFDFQPGVNARWFLHFVSREAFYRGQLGLANGGRKARRVNPADLLKVVINVPGIDEQNKIAAIIDHAERIVRAEENKLVMLRAEKAALMQQLLTGKRRVRVPAKVEAEPA